MKDVVDLREFCVQNSENDKLILCTLIQKTGSGYRGIGAKKVVALNGGSCGLMSGGCLEATIEKQARSRFHQLPFTEKFSTLAEEDRLLGYQTGCQGEITLLFERIQPGELDLYFPFGVTKRALGVAIDLSGRAARSFQSDSNVPAGWFFDPWVTPVQLLIVGCGPDADCYLPLAQNLGWDLEFLDHRREFAEASRFPCAKVRHLPVESLAQGIPQGSNVAVVLMTHNYEVDLEVIRGLKHHQLGYLGCLGPRRRFELLKSDLARLYNEQIPLSLEQIVHAPAGIFRYSPTPGEIALSVIAQIQECLIEKSRARTWAVILAAGSATRFGGPKALAQWGESSLLAHAENTAISVCGSRTLIITGGHQAAISSHVNRASVVHNSNWQSGMGTSIAAGVAAVIERDSRAESVLILPVDQPLITVEHITKLFDESRRSDRCAFTMSPDGVIGAPAVLPRRLFDRATKLSGDVGIKSALSPAEFIAVECANALHDIDRPEDVERLWALNISKINPTVISP